MPNTAMIGDPKYRVINATTLEIQYGEGWHRYTKCTTDTNPVLDYANMPSPNPSGKVAPEPDREDSTTESEEDQHRPPCNDASCQRIRAVLRQHYCGKSPAGNGPDDSCDLRDREKRSANVRAIADYTCEWNESTNTAECKQQGQVTREIRKTLVGELQRQGLPADAPGEIYFKVWKSDRVDWSLTEAYYSHLVGSDIELCEVIAVIGSNARVTVLRKLPLTKTDADVPTTTDWSLLDLADTRGNGDVDVILVGDAYENHWLEVISVKNGCARTIFSGLGYYL